jgi:hypothetical protein
MEFFSIDDSKSFVGSGVPALQKMEGEDGLREIKKNQPYDGWFL